MCGFFFQDFIFSFKAINIIISEIQTSTHKPFIMKIRVVVSFYPSCKYFFLFVFVKLEMILKKVL